MIYGREPIVYITNAVGINTSNPASTLDVNGNINAMTNLQENYINLSNKYMKITNTTRKQCFTFTCPSGNLITINGGTYYKYDIDLRNYTNTFSSEFQLIWSECECHRRSCLLENSNNSHWARSGIAYNAAFKFNLVFKL